MNVIKCKNGHFFDGDTYSTCPHCGEEPAIANNSVSAVKEEKKGFWSRKKKDTDSSEQMSTLKSPVSQMPLNDFCCDEDKKTDVMEYKAINKPQDVSVPILGKNPTLDFWQTSPQSDNETNHVGVEETIVTEEVIEEKKPIEIKGDDRVQQIVEETSQQPQVSSLREAIKNASANTEGKTMSYFSSATSSASAASVSADQSKPNTSTEPVVGWLVCVAGVHFGECFSIYAGKNSIGRNGDNRIVIPSDNSISRSKHALIVYEPKKRNFYLQPGDSSGLTYLNDDYITESHKITLRDIIELGDSKFMFIPLCCETFSWEDYMKKGE